MPVTCMTYDLSGSFVATGSSDSSVRVWDVAKGYCTHNFKDHAGVIQGVRFHPDEDRLLLVSLCEDAGVRSFDLRDSACLCTLQEHMSTPTGVAFSIDGYIMVSCSRDKVRYLYTHVTCIHTHLFLHLSIHLSMHPSIYLSIHLYISLSHQHNHHNSILYMLIGA
jgi:WD40 repeat protein